MMSAVEWGLMAILAAGVIIPFLFIIRVAMSAPENP